MTKIQEVKQKVNSLEDEFYSISAMYNLHIIQLKNCYNQSILEAYEPYLRETFDYVTMHNNNQVLFYSIDEKYLKTINLSIEMFKKIWHKFLKNIEKLSIKESSKVFYNGLKDEQFLKTEIGQCTRKYIFLKHNETTSLFFNKLVFVYRFKTKKEQNFLKNNANIWLYMSKKMLNTILKNKEEIVNLKKPLPIKCDPFDKNFC